MAAFKVKKFQSPDMMEVVLNGGVIGGRMSVGGITGLVGQSILITTASTVEVVFAVGTDPLTLTFAEIKSQIEAAATDVTVFPVGPDGQIGIVETTPSDGVSLTSGIVGTTDLTAITYPGDLQTLTVILDGSSYAFAAGQPTDEDDLVAELNAEFTDYDFSYDSDNHLVITRKGPEAAVIGAGTANTELGLTAGTYTHNAKELLGFGAHSSSGYIVTGTKYAFDNTPTPPCVYSTYYDARSGSHVAVVWE